MTREFNKQRRDDTRPSFRDRSSNTHGEERPARPGRTRLNRETVDRAWESGAQHTHADYRPRTNNGQPPRNNWRNNQQPSGYSSSQNSHGSNRPYSNNTNRQEHYRDNSRSFERTSDDSNGPRNPRARSFGPNTTGRQDYNNSRPGEQRPYDNARPGERRPYGNARPGEQRSYGERPHGPGARPDYRRDNGRPGGQSDRFQGQNRGRDNQRPSFERNERPYSQERRGPGGQYNQRSGPDTRNPRWQSRTWTRQASPEEQQEHSSRAYDEQFEGDYERFNNNESSPGQRDTSHRGSHPEGGAPFRNKPRREHEAESPEQERHVTRLPDGRVIKGPRPIQRQEARFWTEVTNDTEDLVGHVKPEEKVVNGTPDGEATEAVSDTADKPSKKPRTRSASATVRGRKAAAPKEKVRGPRPKPSQRGFQWPAP